MAEYSRTGIGKRIYQARTEAKIGQQRIGKLLGVSKQLVSHWEHSRSELPVYQAVRLAKVLNVSVAWLLGGDVDKEEPLLAKRARRESPVPELDDAGLLRLARGDDSVTKTGAIHFTEALCSDEAYCYKIVTRAMANPAFGEAGFLPGHLVTIDPRRLPEAGDCVMIAFPTKQEVCFGRFRAAKEGGRPEPPFVLRLDNPDYLQREVSKSDHPVFLGTMVEHTRVSSR